MTPWGAFRLTPEGGDELVGPGCGHCQGCHCYPSELCKIIN